jgi:hypothetical protein
VRKQKIGQESNVLHVNENATVGACQTKQLVENLRVRISATLWKAFNGNGNIVFRRH